MRGWGWVRALLWVALGAIPGALLRWVLPSTLAANTLGCFVFGAAGLLGSPPDRRRWFVGVGFASSLTTFSSWMLELVRHLDAGRWDALLGQILCDGGLGLVALQLGTTLHRRIHRRLSSSPEWGSAFRR